MSLSLTPITESAIIRAENADPHSCRCLVENCSRKQAVQMAYVFDRKHGATVNVVDSLEWGWGMKRGTLNLDTRRNIFFLGASLYNMYKERKWALVPDQDILYQYFDERRLRPLKRPQFPQIEGDIFQYKLIPIQGMEDIYITRQSDEHTSKHVDVHHYPFDDFPIISSHVHPKYVILHLGDVLRNLEVSPYKALLKRHPWLNELDEVCVKWKTMLPGGFSEDLTFMGPTSDNNTPTTHSGLSGATQCTPLRRIPLMGHQSFAQRIDYAAAAKSSSSQASSSYVQNTGSTRQVYQRSRKRPSVDDSDDSQPSNKKRLLTFRALRGQEKNENLESPKWTSDRIASWAKGCLSHVPPTTSPSSPARHPQPPSPPSKPKSPLRRSARLKSKINRI